MTRCSLLGIWFVTTAMALAGMASSAAAQDMTFGEEEVATVPQAPTEGPPSPQLSEALRLTEGRHPKDLRELRELAAAQEPDLLRWIPAGTKEAA